MGDDGVEEFLRAAFDEVECDLVGDGELFGLGLLDEGGEEGDREGGEGEGDVDAG